MLPSEGKLEQARKARDPRFDGRFFVGVRTTGIYCRPVCPVKMPRAENVVFFDSAAAASEAGYRPCLRCRPEASPGTPAWQGTSATVKRALRLIDEGALDQSSVAALSERLGITQRHLNRLFTSHVGASPKTIAQTRRLHFAKRLIDETTLSMTDIAMSAGYGSIRRFNDHFQQTYERSPRRLRSQVSTGRASGVNDQFQLKVQYREPFDFEALLAFYGLRATPGVEEVGTSYRRAFEIDGQAGCLTVNQEEGELVCTIEGGSPRSLMELLRRVRRMFDTDAVPDEINEVLAVDPIMARLVSSLPGLRLPGAFEPFETAVRAIVGQQVSVKGATTIMGRMAERYGHTTAFGVVFPDAAGLKDLDPESLSMPRKRALAIRELARRVDAGQVVLDLPDDESFRQSLIDIPGVGPWTADYIALRVRADPDAFLQGDLVLKKSAANLFGITDETALVERAEAWRPWRGYAGMHIWRYASIINQ